MEPGFRRTALVAVLAIWALVTACLALGFWLAIPARAPLATVTAWVSVQTGAWLPIALGLVACSPRLARAAAAPLLGFHAVAGAAAAALQPVLQWLGMSMLLRAGVPPVFAATSRALGELIASKLAGNLAVYAAIGGLLHAALLAHRRQREQRLLERIKAEAQAAQLRALQARLHPHFLFNALHSAVALIDEDPRTARTMLVRLADLLRRTLEATPGDRVPLDEELRWSEAYLEIERVRFEERLSWTLEADEQARAVPVPPQLLQPLVENAITHGIAACEEGGVVVLRARAEDPGVRIEIETRLRGEPAPRGAGLGIGLESTRDRLALLYAGAARVSLDLADGRSRVTVVVPGEAA